jgi:hypothetical protein
VVTADRLELTSTDPWRMHGQACIAREELLLLLPVPQSRRRDDE